MNLHIDQLIIYKGGDEGFNFGLAKAYSNHLSGKSTKSSEDAVMVRWLQEEKKYLVVDGYHRIVKGLLEGKESFRCKVDWFGKKSFWIPPKKHRFDLKEYQNERSKSY